MKRIVLIYGLILGAFIGAFMLTSTAMTDLENVDFNDEQIKGYLSFLVGLSLVFVGIKQVRDKHLGGYISFGTAFKTGLFILLIGNFIYSLSWTIYHEAADSNFAEVYKEHALSQADNPEDRKEIEEQMEFVDTIYGNPILNFLFTFAIELLPVGLVMTLVASLIFKRKRPETV